MNVGSRKVYNDKPSSCGAVIDSLFLRDAPNNAGCDIQLTCGIDLRLLACAVH